MNRNVLVCGVSGFMGRNIFEYFQNYDSIHPPIDKQAWLPGKRTYDVFGIAKHEMFFSMHHKCNLLKPKKIDKLFKEIKPDIVIQAAATTSGSKDIVNQPYLHVTDNVAMNSFLLRACYEHKIKHFIFLSCGVLYEQNTGKAMKEEDINYNLHPTYFGAGWGKLYTEKACEFYSRLGNTKFTVIRHSNTIGPYDKYGSDKSHVFAALITKVVQAKDGEEIEIWGNGSEARDLVNVKNVCNFIDIALKKQESNFEIYNIGCEYAITVKELAEKIIKISGKKLTIKYNTEKPTIPTSLFLDCSKAKALGWKYNIDLDKSIKQSLDYYKAYYEH